MRDTSSFMSIKLLNGFFSLFAKLSLHSLSKLCTFTSDDGYFPRESHSYSRTFSIFSFFTRQRSSTFHQFNFHKTTKQAELRVSEETREKNCDTGEFIFSHLRSLLKLSNTQKLFSFNTQMNFSQNLNRGFVVVG